MERGTLKIGAPENRIVNAIYMRYVLTPRDNDLLYPVFGPVLTALVKIILTKSEAQNPKF